MKLPEDIIPCSLIKKGFVMNKILIACLVATTIFFPLAASADTTSYATFANIPFGSTHAQVRHLTSLKGYVYDSVDSTSTSDIFKGTTDDVSSSVVAKFDNSNRLAKVIVILGTADSEVQDKYTEVHDQLINKYGTPNNDFHFYSDPYFAGDGYEQQALRLGKASFSAYWAQPNGYAQLSVEISTNLTVNVIYEGPSWHDYVQEHKANVSHDL